MTGGITLFAPMAGWLASLDDVPDPAFAGRMVGDGAAIEPLDDKLRAPCDATVIGVAPTRHAVTLRLASGAELLLHVGLDTVKLQGEGFTAHVVDGQAVARGDILLSFDVDALATRARSLITPIIVTSEGFTVTIERPGRLVSAGDPMAILSGVGAAPEAVSSGTEVRRVVTVPLANGIHARPAARLATLARSFASELSADAGGRRAALRSTVGLMTLGIRHGDEVAIVGRGPDAADAVAAIADLIAGGMDENEAHAPASVTPAPSPDGSMIQGVCASPGMAVGRARQLRAPEYDVPRDGQGLEHERAQLRSALAAAAARLAEGQPGPVAAAHIAMLDDPELVAAAEAELARGRSAAAAWRSATRDIADQLRASGNALLAERAADLRDLENQVIARLVGAATDVRIDLADETILLADELLPSQFAALDHSKLAGICTARGGSTSHVAILAASAGIPMIVAAGERVGAIEDGIPLLLDADSGRLQVEPDRHTVATARATIDRSRSTARDELARGHAPCACADGVRVEVFANIGTPADALRAVELGAEGCGLLRTEFLFLDRRTAPSADEQLAAYQAIADALDGRPLILRTLDIGGDKPVPYLPSGTEENPALGLRGVRLSLAHPELLDQQLEAVLRIRSAGPCRVMIPMVSDLDELRRVRTQLDSVAARLGSTPRVELGIMVETPAAALLADRLAEEADFLSIGTNDLTQYALAIDRGNAALADQVDGLHPAVLALIKLTIDGAKRHGRWVGICGALAADPAATAILVGFGADELSVVPAAVPALKARVRALRAGDGRRLAAEALELASAAEVRALVRRASDVRLEETI